MNPQFRNIDLEITTAIEPKRMISELGTDIIVLFSGPVESGYFLAIETSIEYPLVEDTINQFKSLFNQLSPMALSEWSSATNKTFNFGYDCKSDCSKYELHIPFSAVAILADLGASIGITLYNTAEQDAAANP